MGYPPPVPLKVTWMLTDSRELAVLNTCPHSSLEDTATAHAQIMSRSQSYCACPNPLSTKKACDLVSLRLSFPISWKGPWTKAIGDSEHQLGGRGHCQRSLWAYQGLAGFLLAWRELGSLSTLHHPRVCHLRRCKSVPTKQKLFWNLPMNPKMYLMVGTRMTRTLLRAMMIAAIPKCFTQLKGLLGNSSVITEVRICNEGVQRHSRLFNFCFWSLLRF